MAIGKSDKQKNHLKFAWSYKYQITAMSLIISATVGPVCDVNKNSFKNLRISNVS